MRGETLTGTYLAQGDWACAEGAIAAGCRFFAGYPITPATEIMERMAVRLPQVGGDFVQFEDEIASMAAVVGASYAGAKAMTATSGPGLSLMAENIGLALMTEAPCVVVDIMRGGPSTGQPTMAAQGDLMQARWLTHGDYEMIALAPASVQEMFDLTVEAFNLAERYRLPVLLLADALIGQMYEKLVIPEADQVRVESRKKPTVGPGAYLPFQVDDSLVPAMACFGEGYHFYVTGLTHDESGYPDMSSQGQGRLVTRLCAKVRDRAGEIMRLDSYHLEDAEVAVVAYGMVARSARRAVDLARERGLRAGLLRLVTVWPFPTRFLDDISHRLKALLVPEMNCGQLVHEVQGAARGCSVHSLPKPGPIPHSTEEIMEAIEGIET